MRLLSKESVHYGLLAGVAVVITAVVWGNVVVTNRLMENNEPAVSITPGTIVNGRDGKDGERGPKGDSPTATEIRQAVANYCASTGLCEGRAPSQAVVYAAVTKFCSSNECRGASGAGGFDGKDGKDAAPVTDSQIQQQVVLYCRNNNCVGPTGADGTGLPGTDGQPGTDGLSPLISCVIRDGGISGSKYVAWRYEDETDSAYRDIYKLPTWAECQTPVDLRGISS
ncbi:hypothetical protein [Rhodococcus erythropolis]|uniref:hypothetical protein n=1 Tax=Rhodococcus erythropolis TaxID=1833 RepID=UPI003013D047